VERKRKRALCTREHKSCKKEVAKLIRERMDATEAQDQVDARPLKYSESGSDGEAEEEELESLGGKDFGTDTSLCGMSGPRAPKSARDEAEPESAKRLKDEGSDAPRSIGDVSRDDDCALSPGCGGTDGLPPPVVMAAVASSPPTPPAETVLTKITAKSQVPLSFLCFGEAAL